MMLSASFPLPVPNGIGNTSNVSTLDQIFRSALAAAARVNMDTVVVNAKGQRPSRRNEEASFNAGIAAAQGTGLEVAERVKSGLNLQLQLRGLPPASLKSLTVTGGGAAAAGGYSSVGLIVGLVLGCCLAASVCLIVPYMWSKARVESQEERLMRCTMLALRERLGITLREGFVLSTETGAVLTTRHWCCASRARKLADMTVVRRSYLESAARLALLEVALSALRRLKRCQVVAV